MLQNGVLYIESKHLLSRMLVTNPSARTTLQEVMSHSLHQLQLYPLMVTTVFSLPSQSPPNSHHYLFQITKGFHPLISMHYLFQEKVECYHNIRANELAKAATMLECQVPFSVSSIPSKASYLKYLEEWYSCSISCLFHTPGLPQIQTTS